MSSEQENEDIPISYEHRIIKEDLKELKSLCVIETNYPIKSHSKIFGPFIVLLKKIMRKVVNKSLGWYINPLVEQQNKVNMSVVEILELYDKSIENNIGKCLDELDRHDALIDAIDKRVEELKDQNEDSHKLFTESIDNIKTSIEQNDESHRLLSENINGVAKHTDDLENSFRIFTEQNDESHRLLSENIDSVETHTANLENSFRIFTEQNDESHRLLSENIDSVETHTANLENSFRIFTEQNDESHRLLSENIDNVAAYTENVEKSLRIYSEQNDESHKLLSDNTNSVSKRTQDISDSLKRTIIQNEEKCVNLISNIESVAKQTEEVNESLLRVIAQNDESHKNLGLNIESVNNQRIDSFNELEAKIKEHTDKLKYMTRVLNIDCDTKLLNKRINYLDFENRFRGTRKEIMEKQRQFVHYFRDTSHGAEILDIGSGRGEFLELMANEEIKAYGVDVYKPFVTYCRRRGFRVENDDALSHLSKIPDSVLGGIFMDSVVEHVSDDYLVNLVGLLYKKLRPGCYCIITTPNPETLAGLNCFNIDLEHKKPIHYLTLEYLLKKENFAEVTRYETKEADFPIKISKLEGNFPNKTEFNAGIDEINKFVFGNREYVVIARK